MNTYFDGITTSLSKAPMKHQNTFMMRNSKIDIKNAGFRFGKLDTSCDQSYKLSSIRNRFNKKMYVLSSIRNRQCPQSIYYRKITVNLISRNMYQKQVPTVTINLCQISLNLQEQHQSYLL